MTKEYIEAVGNQFKEQLDLLRQLAMILEKMEADATSEQNQGKRELLEKTSSEIGKIVEDLANKIYGTSQVILKDAA